ncbi:hypothetical protein GQ600_4634 [Phytophthora cactorum]|nr:hypothetical protein GQ600_4634 [Phytophthora cactorum]
MKTRWQFWFGHMKNDQEGDRQRDPRHIFANPMEPDMCPILSLAIYFAVVGFNYGSYSARKGSSTYMSGCCTGGPSSASVCLRAGWNLPGVQDTYVRYEAAGDRVVGRFVAGLPYETPDFAILPSFFNTMDGNVTSLFRDTTLLSELKPKVVCRCWQTGDAIRASGIPPHLGVVVNMENRLDSVGKSIAELHSAVADNVHRMQG